MGSEQGQGQGRENHRTSIILRVFVQLILGYACFAGGLLMSHKAYKEVDGKRRAWEAEARRCDLSRLTCEAAREADRTATTEALSASTEALRICLHLDEEDGGDVLLVLRPDASVPE